MSPQAILTQTSILRTAGRLAPVGTRRSALEEMSRPTASTSSPSTTPTEELSAQAGNIFVSIGGNYTSGRIEASIDNSNRGTIGSGANITFNVGGNMISPDAAFFTIDNTSGGVIGLPPAINVSANNIMVDGLYAWVNDGITSGQPGGSTGTVKIQANGMINVGGFIDVFGDVIAGGDINCGGLQSTNVTTPGNIIVGNFGIQRFVQPFTNQFPDVLHTLTAASVTSLGGINFNGVDGTVSSAPTDGGQLTINANSLSFGPTQPTDDIIGPITFNGGSGVNSSSGGASGGTFTVNTTGAITVDSDIEATSGLQSPSTTPSGNGGTVNLNSTADTVTVNNRIQVSSADSIDTTSPIRRSAKGGNIKITSGKAGLPINGHAVAINISNSSQLLALLDAAAPGPGGKVVISASGTNSDINVKGNIQADRGTIDIRHTADNGNVNLSSASTSDNLNMHADVLKAAALGSNGQLNIGGGTLSADTMLQLYATGSNGQVNFVASVTLGGNSTKIIAGDTVNIFNGVFVTIGGNTPANVYVNSTGGVPNANYTGFGGNGSRTGTFRGAGASNPQPLNQAPPIGPPPGR